LHFIIASSLCFRHHRTGLQAPHQKKDDYNYEYDPDDSTGTVTPAASVRPSWQGTHENQDQDNKQYGSKAHDFSYVTGVGTIKHRISTTAKMIRSLSHIALHTTRLRHLPWSMVSNSTE
jgi:hypothetical protein